MLFLLICVCACVLGGLALFVVMHRHDKPFLGMVGLGVMLVAALLAAAYAGATSA